MGNTSKEEDKKGHAGDTPAAQTIDFATVLASSVHDMKNSVGMLLASLEGLMVDMPPSNSDESHRYTILQYEASRINSELIQLLTIYRLQNTLLPVRVDEHYIIDVLDDQIARNHLLLETSAITLHYTCDDNLSWYYDLDLIGSIINNVLVNCIRYTNTCIAIHASVVDNMLCIRIEDDGPGYPEAMLNNPLVMVANNDPDTLNDPSAESNTHLGLYFANKIATLHTQQDAQGQKKHGYIQLENKAEGGGVFKVFLP